MSGLPTFYLKTVEAKRDRLLSAVFAPLYGQVPDIPELTSRILQRMPTGVTQDAVFESVRYLAGEPLERLEAIKLAWRLAGNISTLKANKPVQPWTFQRWDEWVPVQVLRVQRERDQKNRVGYSARLRVLAGTPCPNIITCFWTRAATYAVAPTMGFSQSWGKYPFHHQEDLVGLRFLARIESARSRNQPVFHEIACPGSMVAYNRDEVLKLRLRVDRECPRKYVHACARCVVGYDQCPAGTHQITYEIGHCDGCSNSRALFDPEDDMENCIVCNSNERLKSKKV